MSRISALSNYYSGITFGKKVENFRISVFFYAQMTTPYYHRSNTVWQLQQFKRKNYNKSMGSTPSNPSDSHVGWATPFIIISDIISFAVFI